MSKETAKDEMLNLCIQQEYVPPECNLTGMIVFGLVQEGKNPCIGCNVNCPHAQKSLTPLEREQQLEQYWVARALKNNDMTFNYTKTVVGEREFNHYPTLNEIAQFLFDSGADFVSVVQNYRSENELPFC